uniref:Uncharacterized protein n=1 Tax=Globodera rostochiensis TaxID=31243 RepID=A0A914HCJ9_GLORO
MHQLKDNLIAKMEKYQNKQQHSIDELTEMQLRNEQLNALQKKIVKMEEYQKEQEQNIVGLQKTVVTLREIVFSIGLTLQNRLGFRCIVTLSIPRKDDGIFYYEVTIIEESHHVFIGLATKQMPLGAWVRGFNGTYAYGSIGRFWGHAV